MEQERSESSQKEAGKITPEKDTAEDWFKLGCYLASQGEQEEAEIAIKNALNIQDVYPIAWAILSAILLAQGRETDAEKAGKKAIAQCAGFKMTWPKMRSIIFYNGIVKGASWKDPRRVVIESIASNEWGNLLSTLSKASQQELDAITTFEETPTEEVRTPITTLKSYGTTGKKYEVRADAEKLTKKEESKELESYIDYTREKSKRRKREPRKSRPPTVEAKKTPVIPVRKQDSIEADEWIATAESQIKQGDLKGAEAAFLQGLKIDPNKGGAWLSLSSLRMRNYKYDEAVVALKRAVELIPASSAAWFQLGYCLQKLNKWKDAIQPIKNAIKIDENNPDFWMALGLSEYHLGQIEVSAKSFLRVLRISPNHKDALFHLAKCMEKQGNRKHALSLYLKLLNIAGLDHKMLQRLAGALERLNRPREASQARSKAAFLRSTGKR